MKNVIILIALVMLSKPLWPVVEYAINYDYIVDKLCENKDKPEMQCNGKCYLTEQLAKEAAGEEQNPFRNNSQKTEIPQFIISEDLPDFQLACTVEFSSDRDLFFKPNLYNSLFTSKILHPPQS
ncbi:hypothetical protein [Salinimicrobium flavum]|uniref:Uncharacterized protein n=1 Tax=Salinimicrobium flavum TaxID=1737065 RepID=A0ABW5IY32_9FLAO